MDVNENTTLIEAIRWLQDRVNEGAECPCCGQYAKVYKNRTISGRMARDLINAYRAVGVGVWFRLPDFDTTNETSKLAHWNLIEERAGLREDGAKHAGWWRITELGGRFVCNEASIPKRAMIYSGTLLGLDNTESVTITDVLGKRFNYAELMGFSAEGLSSHAGSGTQ